MYILILKEPKQIKNGIVDDDSESNMIRRITAKFALK